MLHVHLLLITSTSSTIIQVNVLPPALPSIVVTDNNEKLLGIRRKSSLFWRRLSLEFSSDDSRRGSLSPNISRRNSATNAEPSGVPGSAVRRGRNFADGRKRSEGPSFEKWFPSLLHRVANTASADWLPISSSKSVPEVLLISIVHSFLETLSISVGEPPGAIL